MHHAGKFFRNQFLFLFAGLIALAVPLSEASDGARVSGSYQIVQKTNIGSQTRVRVQLRLTNNETSELHIQRLILWDFSHPQKGGTQPCAILLAAGVSVETTQEFTIPRAEYELWTRGGRPRLVIEVQSSGGRTIAEAVRLDREFKGKAER